MLGIREVLTSRGIVVDQRGLMDGFLNGLGILSWKHGHLVTLI